VPLPLSTTASVTGLDGAAAQEANADNVVTVVGGQEVLTFLANAVGWLVSRSCCAIDRSSSAVKPSKPASQECRPAGPTTAAWPRH
jgi:hypothetical protein